MKHYPYGGSVAPRQMHCPAWLNLAKDLPPQESSDAANLGTALHACIHAMNTTDGDVQVGDVFEGIEITQDLMDDKIQPALEAFHTITDKYNIVGWRFELKLEADPMMGGTLDAIGWSESGDTIVCLDWKFGDGVIVNAERNAQALFYLMLYLEILTPRDRANAKKLVVAIVQPSARNPRVWDAWELDQATLDQFADEYYASVDKTDDGVMEPVAGEGCKFCPVLPTCPAKQQLLKLPERYSPEHLATLSEAMARIEEMQEWITALKAATHDQLDKGAKVRNWKIVQSRAQRKWTDEAQARGLVQRAKKVKLDEATTSTLLSVAQMEKLYKRKKLDFEIFAELIEKKSGSRVLAPESDPRPAAIPLQALGIKV